ncbi:MAG TPA: EAL domain-containing protein [Solirubrobacteraceae bacterium]|nr:EAL domain-containing protein [Solirubrobacteraceae bacterium]
MSPLLNTRPSDRVTHRLLAACLVMAALAIAIAISAGDYGRPLGASPAFLGAGTVCAALIAYLLAASARAMADPKLTWMAAGTGIACAGLLLSLLGSPTIFPTDAPVTQSADAGAARYLVWHAGLAAAAVLAVAGVLPTRGRLVALIAPFALLLAWTSFVDAPLGDLVGLDNQYTALLKLLVAAVVLVQVGAAIAWWRAEDGAPTWGAMCMIAALGLSAGDGLAYVFAPQAYSDAWWASLTLRAGQFAIPSVGLVMGFVGLADKLREIQEEIEANFAADRERAAREEELAGADRARREELAGRVRRLIGGEGLDVALQPIVDLASGEVVGAEALARFTDIDGHSIPTEDCFLDAHALDLGTELELAAIQLALESHDRLPEGLYLAMNASPALLGGDELLVLLASHERRPLVVELTEHQAVEDYATLGRALDALREHGVRVAIDDVGSGFSSFRHVTRVNPEILKLDRSLVCGIDDDPVRQSLAAAIVAFAADVGAVVVSEGIESEAELSCLRGLAVGLGQGFFLGRPGLGSVARELAEPVA